MTDTAIRARRATSPRQWLSRVLVVLLLAGFVAFFILPIIWLVLAPTKSNN